MRDAKTPKVPCYCLRTWSSCSMISATGSWCASSRTSFHRRAHSGRWRSVRGRGKSHNHRIFGGAAGCGRRACPERRRRREQQESAATAQRASEDRVDELLTFGQCDLRLFAERNLVIRRSLGTSGDACVVPHLVPVPPEPVRVRRATDFQLRSDATAGEHDYGYEFPPIETARVVVFGMLLLCSISDDGGDRFVHVIP